MRQRERGLVDWVTLVVACAVAVLLSEQLPFAVGLVIALAVGAVVGLIVRWQRRLR